MDSQRPAVQRTASRDPREAGQRATARAGARSFRARFLAALLCALVCTTPRAQDSLPSAAEVFGATWWNITNGLPQSSINALVQNEDGELWIATDGGLLCFDGIEFRRLDLDTLPGLRSNRITALVADGSRGLWFTTQEGALHHLSGGRIDQSHQVPGSEGILTLLIAGDDSMWTQAASGVVHRFHSGAWTEVLPARGGGRYRGLCARRDGVICVAARNELVMLQASGVELARMSAPAEILALAPNGDHGVWVGLVDGLARAHEGTIDRLAITPPIEQPVQVVVEDAHGAVWIGMPRGATRIWNGPDSGPGMKILWTGEMAPDLGVRSILLDREGNVWLGGSEAGLLRMRPYRLQLFQRVPGWMRVTALCDDGEGEGGAWVGYANRGLAHIVAGEPEELDQPLDVPGPSPPIVRSLLHDARGRTWVGVNDTWVRRNEGDLDEFDPVLPDRQLPTAVGPMAELPDGGVWLSTESGHLLRLGVDDVVREELDLPGPIQSLSVAPDTSLWVGGVDQVFRVRDGVVTRFGPEEGLPFGTVRDLLPEAGGDVWIATYGGGLALFSNGRVRKLTSQNGLFDSSLSRILFDGRDRLWMLSNLGLMIAERADLMAVLEGRRSRIDPIVIGPEAGMNEASSGAPAGFRDARGRMWFGMISGAVRIDAQDFPFHRTEPTPRILSVRADDLVLEPVGTLEIPSGTRRLQFEFTAFALTAPERMRFRYCLDGYDEDWIDADRSRQASYTALTPGGYTFHVTARNEDGVWSSQPQSLRLEIRPAWWQTPRFRAFLVLIAIGALFALHRLRIGIVQRRAQALLEATKGRVLAEERSSRLRDELAHVARVATAGELATSLAHEVNQPLAAIVTNAEAARRFLARDGTSSADLDVILRDIAQQGERASEVIRRLRQFLRKHETERSALDVNELVHETLPLVRRELEDHAAVIELDLAADLPSIAADPIQIQQVLVNLVKNACDAMSNHVGERRIRLCSHKSQSGIAIEVHDTGPGIAEAIRERLFQPYVTTKPTGMGLGLAICRTIVEAHGGRVGLVPAAAGGAAFRVDLPSDSPRGGAQ